MELLKEVAPKASRVAVLYNPADRSNVLVLKELQKSAPALGLTLQPLEVREPGEFEGAFVAMTRKRAHALSGAAGILTFEHRKAIVDLAAKSRVPAMWGHRQFVEAGGLMSYAVNLYDQVRRATTYVDKILKGAKPGDLPVQQPTRFELVITPKKRAPSKGPRKRAGGKGGGSPSGGLPVQRGGGTRSAAWVHRGIPLGPRLRAALTGGASVNLARSDRPEVTSWAGWTSAREVTDLRNCEPR